MMDKERYQQAKQVTLLGAIVNAMLGCIKLAGGWLFHSHALVADGIHSFSDLITDLMVVFASKYGSQDADDSHPYGHQRIETAATLMLALLLILAGTGIAWDALDEAIRATPDTPGWIALPIALCSILANEALFHYTYHVGKRIQSTLVIANAWHHRSDAASSIVVALGLAGSLLGFSYLDAIAAIIVGFMIVKMGIDYGWSSVKELIDTAVEPEMLGRIENIIQTVDGVEKIHQLRSRLMGGDVLVDVHILVSPYISVSEGHYIAQQVHQALVNQLERVKDVIVHVDPEDDEVSCPSLHLPNRNHLYEQLISAWQKNYPSLQNWDIHYLDGKITLDLICNQDTPWQALSEQIAKDLKANNKELKVRLFSTHGVIH
ncbi:MULTISPECIES: cation diffusion facilitator family transporter [unclassified Legionella]|uniref:cation diffusion facilitator family transporter n=1 Tax=unclassified Legionella TaxID=2622702 RepID=UPI001054B3D6|nr:MULTISPECIES: cation diffusion facilitator family transporter [unclassified Legionella]MDI9817924.1 cation diffusion facilitator family transporter [Legionella sp. PL877]